MTTEGFLQVLTMTKLNADTECSMTTKYTVELADGIDGLFTSVADEAQISKAELVRKALQLFIASRKAIQQGNRVGVVNKQGKLLTEFTGL
jgi:hypothetical protein